MNDNININASLSDRIVVRSIDICDFLIERGL